MATDWWILCGCYAAAAVSKEQGFLLPLFLVAAEVLLVDAPAKGSRRQWVAGVAALAAVGMAVALIRTLVLGGATPSNVAEALQGQGVGRRALTALQLVPEWLRLVSWPARLRLDYSPREFLASSAFGAREGAGAVLLLLLVAVAWSARRRAPAITFGIAWLAIALAPVSNILLPTGVLIAERTLFLPSIGWLLAIGGAVAASGFLRQRGGRAALVTVAAALVVAGVVRSAVRHRDWRDTDALTRSAMRDSPLSWRANANHGDLLFREGRLEEGRAAYARAIAFAPSPWWIRHAFARHLSRTGDHDAALAQLATAIAEFPGQPEMLRDVIATLINMGRYGEARGIATRLIDAGRESAEIVRLGRLADSAVVAGAPAGAVRVEIASPRSAHQP
jgi:tetratricopeptide (TPR) repeat protein